MRQFVIYIVAVLITFVGALAQTVSFTTKLTRGDGRALQGIHTLDFLLRDKLTHRQEPWKQQKTMLIRDGSIFIDLGDEHQGATGAFPSELMATHILEIVEDGRVLQALSLSGEDETERYGEVKGTDDVQGAKILLSDIDRGTAADGEVLAWNNTEQSWRPRKVGTGGGDAGTSGVNTLNMLKGNVTIDVAPPLTRKQGDKGITIGIDEGAIPKNTGVPVGTIVAYYGNESRVPKGWLLCDGREFKKSDYPELSDLLKDLEQSPTNTPDLRGQFLRGSNFTQEMKDRDSATGDADFKGRSGTGQKIGSLQTDALQGHSHYINDPENTEEKQDQVNTHWFCCFMYFVQGDYIVLGRTRTGPNNYPGINVAGVRTDRSNKYGDARTASETRPKNVAVNWIIKAN